MIRIITDSAADMERAELEKYSVTCIPLAVSFGDKSYLDGVDLERPEFYRLLQSESEFPKTSQPSPDAFLKEFEAAKEAKDEVIAILVSGGLSGTVQSANIAKEMADYDKIYIVDSLLATGGQQMLVLHAASLRDKGYDAPYIVSEVEKLRDRSRLVAGLDTLEYLCRGGRLSKTAAGIGTLANIKPIIRLTPEGKVVLAEKCLGRKSMINKLTKYLDKTGVDYDFPLCFLYCHDRTNCDEFMDKLRDKGYDLSNIMCINIGPAIGSHIGVGALGVVYFAPEE